MKQAYVLSVIQFFHHVRSQSVQSAAHYLTASAIKKSWTAPTCHSKLWQVQYPLGQERNSQSTQPIPALHVIINSHDHTFNLHRSVRTIPRPHVHIIFHFSHYGRVWFNITHRSHENIHSSLYVQVSLSQRFSIFIVTLSLSANFHNDISAQGYYFTSNISLQHIPETRKLIAYHAVN